MKCLPGILYLVATPIGNLEDITLRALRILRDEVAVVACEDTRQTSKLLHHFEIRKPMIACHEHNEQARAQEIVEILKRGESVALVSRCRHAANFRPRLSLGGGGARSWDHGGSAPGASAALAALAASGLPTNEFRFIGFLPPKQTGAPQSAGRSGGWNPPRLIAYESPHRILESLKDIETELGTRPMVLARELTKIHEEFLRGSAAEIHAVLSARDSDQRRDHAGHWSALSSFPAKADPLEEVAQLEAQGMDRMEAIKTAAKRLGLPKREVYRRAAERGSNRAGTHRD